MAFRMKVDDMFRIGEKTVFTGKVQTNLKAIAKAPCTIEIDGAPAGKLLIEGEVQTGEPNRDLWTTASVSLSRETLHDHEVWLISDEPA